MENTLLQGAPMIAIIDPSRSPGLNYYYSDGTGTGHFICIIGFDSATGMVAISDCNFIANYFGINIVPLSELLGALSGGITYMQGGNY